MSQWGPSETHRSREIRSGPHVNDSIDKPLKGLGFRVLRGAMLSIIAIIGLVVTSALLEGWLFFGISFQQTTVGHVLWPIALFLLNLVHPMT